MEDGCCILIYCIFIVVIEVKFKYYVDSYLMNVVLYFNRMSLFLVGWGKKG